MYSNAAIRELISPELRRGLGIFLTPDDVAKMMVEFVDPKEEDHVLDPACGSGTFLKEVITRRGIVFPSSIDSETMGYRQES